MSRYAVETTARKEKADSSWKHVTGGVRDVEVNRVTNALVSLVTKWLTACGRIVE